MKKIKSKKCIHIDPKIHKQLKVEAVKEEMQIGELAGRLLSKALEEKLK